MADKSFGVKELRITGTGTPTIESPGGGNLNLNAATSTFSGNVSVTGNDLSVGKFKIKQFSDNPILHTNTSDGNDNLYLGLNGGGATSTARGGGIFFIGNEYGSNLGGTVQLYAGNVSEGDILLQTQGSTRVKIDYDGSVEFSGGDVTIDQDIILSNGGGIFSDSNNGSDSTVVQLNGGGGGGNSRGGAVVLYGNEFGVSGLEGNVLIEAGNVNNADINFKTGGDTRITITKGGSIKFHSSLHFSVQSNLYKITTDTSDGSDNNSILIGGGGEPSVTRGALVHINGNELNSGRLDLYAGNNNGSIRFLTGAASTRVEIESDGNVRVSDENLKFDTTGKGIIFGNHGESDRPSIIGNYTSSTDNNIVFSVEGAERVRITSGDNSATNPQGYLHVKGDGDGSIKKFFIIESTHSGYFGPNLVMQHKSSSPADNDVISQVHFNGLDDLNHITNYASIDVQATDVSDSGPKGDMIFNTRKDNVGTIEKLRITSSGQTLPGADNTYDLGSSAKRWDDVYATNGTIQTSDRNYKENILESDLGLDFINKLSPKSFKFKGKTRTHYGLIAQDIETVITDLGKTTTEFAPLIKTTLEDETINYGLRYTEFISPIIKAIQELKAENDSLKARIATLEGS